MLIDTFRPGIALREAERMGRNLKVGRETQSEDSFDDWAGRIIDLLAGVGLISALVGLSAISGLLWDQFGL